MTDAINKLREPAALAALGYAGLSMLAALLNLLIPPSSDGVSEAFTGRAGDQAANFLSVTVAAAVAFALYLANHHRNGLMRARLITLVGLVELGVALVLGGLCTLIQFGDQGPAQSKFYSFLELVGRGLVVAVAAWYAWLTWQQHAAVRPAPGGDAGWKGAGPGPFQTYPPNQPGPPPFGQQMPGQQTPPPGGFGWTPQQSAPQQAPQNFAGGAGPGVPGGAGQQRFGGERTQMLPPVPGGQPPVSPQRPSPDGLQGGLRDQGPIQPVVPPTMQGFAAQPGAWSPGGPGGQQAPPAPTQQFPPVQPQPGQQQPGQGQPPEQQNPFSVGDWQ
jgi:hypothetical protein